MLWIIIAVVAVLVLWVISVQNKLVKSDEFCNNALKQINVQQISRFDALQALIKLTREYASYEAEILQKIVNDRKAHGEHLTALEKVA
jgi:LemA protein